MLSGDVDAAQTVQKLLVAKINVLRDGQGWNETGFLVHHRDALAQRIRGAAELHRLALKEDLPLRRLIHTSHDLCQRGLTGAVFSEERMDLARHEREADIAQRRDTMKLLGHRLEFNDRAHVNFPPDRQQKSRRRPCWRPTATIRPPQPTSRHAGDRRHGCENCEWGRNLS